MAHLSEKVNGFVEAHMSFYKPLRKLRTMGLSSPWNRNAFIRSSEFIIPIIEEENRNQHFQNEDGPLSREEIVELLKQYFHLLHMIVATPCTHGSPLYGLVTKINVMYSQVKYMPSLRRRNSKCIQ